MSRAPSAAHSRTVGLVLVLAVSVIWGFHWVVVKQGLAYMPPFTYGAIRLAIGLVAIVAFLALTRRLRLPPRSDLPIVGWIGLGQVAAGNTIMNLALLAVPAGRSSVIVYSTPLWTALLLWLVFKTPPRRPEVIGLVLGLAGIAALVNPSVIDWGVPAEVLGTLLLVSQAILWGLVAIHIRRHHWTASLLELQPWILLVALAPVAIAMLALELGQPVIWTTETLLILFYSGVISTAFGNWASQSATRSLGPMAASLGFLLAPVVGLISGALVLGESLGPIDLVGFGLVLGGIAVASLTAPPPAAQSGRDADEAADEAAAARPGS
jgi:drug/metabolite transporter (DMT)-like permease